MKKNTQEKVFYKDLNVKVTQSRYITENKAYAMRNISSVSINTIKGCRFCARVVIITGLIAFFIPNDFQILIGVTLIVLGIIWHVSIKDEYAVRIGTNAGESNSIISKDQDYIKKIVAALNEAIVYKGQ